MDPRLFIQSRAATIDHMKADVEAGRTGREPARAQPRKRPGFPFPHRARRRRARPCPHPAEQSCRAGRRAPIPPSPWSISCLHLHLLHAVLDQIAPAARAFAPRPRLGGIFRVSAPHRTVRSVFVYILSDRAVRHFLPEWTKRKKGMNAYAIVPPYLIAGGPIRIRAQQEERDGPDARTESGSIPQLAPRAAGRRLGWLLRQTGRQCKLSGWGKAWRSVPCCCP